MVQQANLDAEICCPRVLQARLAEAEATDLARGFAALADPARLHILSLIATSPNGEACVCELVTPLNKSQPTVSHHLKVLCDAKLIESDRRGKWVWYRLIPDRLTQLQAALTSP